MDTNSMFGNAAGRNQTTVLLIDDDMVSREVIATVLTMNGYAVHTAEDGHASLAILDAGACTPEVILMDTQMPGLSGIALIKELRTRNRALLYAISGSDVSAEVMEGVDGFLMKPFSPDALHHLMQPPGTVPEPSTSVDEPVVNPAILAQLRAIMAEPRVREIFEAIVSDLEKRYGMLVVAIDNGDSVEIRRIGHAIKGGCAMAGAVQASRIGELLETRGDDLEYSRSMLAELQSATLNLKRMLDAELSPRKDPA